MRTSRQPATRSNRRAVTSVEFAMVAPLLFLFFFAQLEFSRANMLRHSLRTACYEGCREGIVVGATTEDIEIATEHILKAIGLKEYTVRVTPAVINNKTRDVTVFVSVPIAENSWYPPFFLQGVTLENQMTMERELTDLLIF